MASSSSHMQNQMWCNVASYANRRVFCGRCVRLGPRYFLCIEVRIMNPLGIRYLCKFSLVVNVSVKAKWANKRYRERRHEKCNPGKKSSGFWRMENHIIGWFPDDSTLWNTFLAKMFSFASPVNRRKYMLFCVDTGPEVQKNGQKQWRPTLSNWESMRCYFANKYVSRNA